MATGIIAATLRSTPCFFSRINDLITHRRVLIILLFARAGSADPGQWDDKLAHYRNEFVGTGGCIVTTQSDVPSHTSRQRSAPAQRDRMGLLRRLVRRNPPVRKVERTRGEKRLFNWSLRRAVKGFLLKDKSLGVDAGASKVAEAAAAAPASARLTPVGASKAEALRKWLAASAMASTLLFALASQAPAQTVVSGSNVAAGGGGAGHNTNAGAGSVTGTSAVVYGANATANGNFAGSFGYLANAVGNNAFAVGANSLANGTNASTLGDNALANGITATAIGQASIANGSTATALGQAANATGVGTTALGQGSLVSVANSVALGAGSVANVAAVSTASTTISGTTYTFSGGTTASGTVSVGNATFLRTITNVAAGQVNATSTDAVTGSQLYAVALALQGGTTKYFHANSTLADSTVNGIDAIAIGPTANASASDAIALGNASAATATGALALGNAANASIANAIALGLSLIHI